MKPKPSNRCKCRGSAANVQAKSNPRYLRMCSQQVNLHCSMWLSGYRWPKNR